MRLSNYVRDGVVRKVLDAKYSKLEGKLRTKFRKQVEKDIKASIPKWVLKNIKSGYFYTSEEVDQSVRRGGIDRFWYKCGVFYPVLKNKSSHKIEKSKELLDLEREVLEFLKEQGEFTVKLRKTLYAFTDTKKLLKEAPELAKYFDGVIPVENALIPLAVIQEVNAAVKEIK